MASLVDCTQVYAAELAPPKLRGPLGGLFNVFISAGILAVFALGARGTDDGVWRWMALAAVAPALAVGLGLHRGWVPESPRWLAQQGRAAEAKEAAEHLFGRGAAADEACAVPEPAKRRASQILEAAVAPQGGQGVRLLHHRQVDGEERGAVRGETDARVGAVR